LSAVTSRATIGDVSLAESKRIRAVVDVFRYRDFREYLAAFYDAKKKHGYSYRAFAKAAAVGAPNYLKLVIDGDRNLSEAMAERFADACRLQGDSRGYFLDLVQFNQAATDDVRNQVHARLCRYPRFRAAQPLELAQKEYHSQWYIPVVRELVALSEFSEEPEWIASVVFPRISRSEAASALAVLTKLGLVERDEHGRLRQSDRALSTGDQARGLYIRNYHAEMMQRATAAMETVPAAERFVSSSTLSASERTFALIRQRVSDFRREMIELCDSDPEPQRVMQLNMQWFPVSTPVAPGGDTPSEREEAEEK
jgi:uncharacterized protein (TIGR02147 family)